MAKTALTQMRLHTVCRNERERERARARETPFPILQGYVAI